MKVKENWFCWLSTLVLSDVDRSEDVVCSLYLLVVDIVEKIL